ncbi:MAG: hypothetical protein ACLTMP_05700 [Eggerthella lenta]
MAMAVIMSLFFLAVAWPIAAITFAGTPRPVRAERCAAAPPA